MQRVVGGEVVAAMLAREGVEKVFGIVDGTYMGLYASFKKYGIELVSPRHETSAAHMAGAYARLTGKLGVCIASNGPGVANVLPGIAVENGEGNRVLVITSSRRQGITYPDRGGAFQYFNQVGVTRAMTKWSGAVPDAARIPELMRRAFRVAYHGRPGVVHIDVPENVMNGPSEIADDYLREPHEYRRTRPIAAPSGDVTAAAELLRGAKRPLIHAGSGVVHARAYAALAKLAELLQAPVSTSWAARGAFPEHNQQALPTSALEAQKEARTAADVVLVIGSRMGETDWWGKAPYWGRPGQQRFIQVDSDEEILGMNRPTDLAILADAGEFMQALARELEQKPADEATKKARAEQLVKLGGIKESERKNLDAALENMASPMGPAHVPHIARKLLSDDDIVVADGGNTAVWVQFFFDVKKPGTVLGTFKFGMLGAGPGQALGAQIAQPEARVMCIIGDGAMGFHAQELETAVRQNLPVVFVVLCDKQWGMVKLTQQFGLGTVREAIGVEEQGTINTDFSEIRFDELARAMGAHGERVADPAELEGTLRRALEANKPAVVHVDVDPMLHLWAPGLQAFKEMHQEPAG